MNIVEIFMTVYMLELELYLHDHIDELKQIQFQSYEWFIFIRHNKNSVSVATGQYLNAVNTHMQFSDRSPRPQVSFSELSDWNTNNRIISNESIDFIAGDDTTEKMKLLTDWQGVLAERWLKIVFSDKKKKSEPWFNNNLRKFILLMIQETQNHRESSVILHIHGHLIFSSLLRHRELRALKYDNVPLCSHDVPNVSRVQVVGFDLTISLHRLSRIKFRLGIIS